MTTSLGQGAYRLRTGPASMTELNYMCVISPQNLP